MKWKEIEISKGEREKMKCKHRWKEISRTGIGKDLAVKQICELCKKEATLYPNLLGDIFGI